MDRVDAKWYEDAPVESSENQEGNLPSASSISPIVPISINEPVRKVRKLVRFDSEQATHFF